MNIKVNEVIPAITAKYPYTHRVEVSGDALAADNVSKWLEEHNLDHLNPSWGIYYLNPKVTSMLILKWS